MNTLSAAILVGGQSSRMGENKALLRLTADGPTMVERVISAVQHVADDVVLVGGESPGGGLPHIPDADVGAGPLAGILAALEASVHSHVVIVACDMPFLSVPLLRAMADLPRDYDVLLPVVGKPQPLHAIYNRTCIPAITGQLRSGRGKVTGWFDQVHVRTLNEAFIVMHDPERRSLMNVNFPDDLAVARGLANR